MLNCILLAHYMVSLAAGVMHGSGGDEVTTRGHTAVCGAGCSGCLGACVHCSCSTLACFALCGVPWPHSLPHPCPSPTARPSQMVFLSLGVLSGATALSVFGFSARLTWWREQERGVKPHAYFLASTVINLFGGCSQLLAGAECSWGWQEIH